MRIGEFGDVTGLDGSLHWLWEMNDPVRVPN